MNIFDLKLTVKNRSHYFDLSTIARHSWALPLAVMLESFDKDYFEVNIHFLCFYLTYTTTSKRWEDLGDKVLFEELDA